MSESHHPLSIPSAPPSLALGEHIRALAWTPDSQTVAAALASGEIVLVDAASNQVSHRFPAHKMGVLQISSIPGGGGWVSSGEDGFIRWWDEKSLGLIREHRERTWVEQLRTSPNGEFLASGSGKVVKIWGREGKLVCEYGAHPSTLSDVVWRADSKGIATASFGNVSLYRLGEAKAYESLSWKTSHVSLAWSPNGRHIAAGSQENTVTYWKLPFRDLEPLHMSGYPSKVKALAWDRESRLLATAGGEMITVWDVSGKGPSGSKPKQLSGHPGRVLQFAFQSKGDFLASGCERGSVWMWTPSRANVGMPAAALEGEVSAMVWSPDDSRLAVGTGGGSLQLLG